MELEINSIISKIADKVKPGINRVSAFDSKFNYSSWERSIPKINHIYELCIRHHYEVAVHAKKDCFPYELLRAKAPNQSQDEWDFQRLIYQPYTRSTWGKALNKTKIIANGQNYSITGWDADQKKYFFDDYPAYHSLVGWFFDVFREEKINFPNKLLVIEPLFIPQRLVIDSEGKESYVVDDTQMVQPIARIVDEVSIVYHKPNHLSIIVDGYEELSGQKYPVFKSFDPNYIYKSVPVRKDDKGKVVYETLPIYRHDWGYVPTRKLGGKPTIIEGEIFYESYFSDAIPDLNRALCLSSNLDMSMFSNLFPIRVVRVDDCQYNNGSENCNGGKIWNPNKSVNGILGGFDICPSCNGSGKANAHSPTGVYAVPTSKGFNDEKQIGVNDVIAYASPGVDVYKQLAETIDKCKQDAISFISKPVDKTTNTVDAALNEREDAHAAILQLSNEIFDAMAFTIQGIGHMRYGSDFAMPGVNKPVTFAFKTSQDITEEISKAVSDKMPSSYIGQLMKEAAAIRFNSSQDAEQYIDLSMKLNPLWSSNITDLRATLGVSVEPIDLMIYQRITHYLEKAFAEYEYFYNMEDSKQSEIIRGYAQADLDAFAKAKEEGVEGIVSAAGTLKGSVGGLTGMIEIVKAVAEGVYDLEAAIALVQDRFGLSYDDAKKQLGTPQLTAASASAAGIDPNLVQ